MSAVRVTAHLDSPVIGVLETPAPLDGIVQWVLAQRDGCVHLSPRDEPTAYELPFARWERDGAWGWCTSRAHPQVAAHLVVDVRRKPDTVAFARMTGERKHHQALGPHKARNTKVQAVWAPTITWDVDTTSPDTLQGLLSDVTHLGKHRNIGYGHVTRWELDPGEPEAWEDRPMPAPGVHVRPPYWHPSTLT